MPRTKYKEWKNGKFPAWTARITWYSGTGDTRLRMEDCECCLNRIFQDAKQAKLCWELFKSTASNDGFLRVMLGAFDKGLWIERCDAGYRIYCDDGRSDFDNEYETMADAAEDVEGYQP